MEEVEEEQVAEAEAEMARQEEPYIEATEEVEATEDNQATEENQVEPEEAPEP